MSTRSKMRIVCLTLFFFVMTISGALVWGADMKIVARVKGTVENRQGERGAWEKLYTSRELAEKDWARTHARSEAKVTVGGAFMRLHENTTVQMTGLKSTPNQQDFHVKQTGGRLKMEVRNTLGLRQNVEIETPTARLAARGTRFQSIVLPDGTTVVGVYGGTVHVVTSKGVSLTLSPGQSLVLYTNGVTLMLEPGVSIIVDSHGNAHAYEDAPGLLFAATLLGNDTLGYLAGPGTVAPFYPDVSSQPGHQGTQDGGGTTTYPSTYPSH